MRLAVVVSGKPCQVVSDAVNTVWQAGPELLKVVVRRPNTPSAPWAQHFEFFRDRMRRIAVS